MLDPPDKEPPADNGDDAIGGSEDGSAHASLWAAIAAAPPVPLQPALVSTRYKTRRKLGSGGMGVVFEAFDATTGRVVALKTLRHLDATALLRFKAEFRLLQGIHHRNLVHLGELLEEDGQWFFTMELIEGNDFMTHVRDSGGASAEHHIDEERLRNAMSQLVVGLSFLHDADRLHRDVKPSNVMVDKNGRVVLLDFGLIRDQSRAPSSFTPQASGTPAYMSPEQAMSDDLTEASDWYSVGVILYEALTGRLPYMPSAPSAAPAPEDRRAFSAAEIRSLAPHASAALAGLCSDLMHPDPRRRPGPSTILGRLRGVPIEPSETARLMRRAAFVGRDVEIQLLRDSYRSAKNGHATAVSLTGVSGIGKSALVAHFVAEVARDGALVLSGRCYERESVPYKALDSLVDALVHEWARMDPATANSLVPEHARELEELFPVMARVRELRSGALAGAQTSSQTSTATPRERRQRAAAALREILTRLADQRSIVLHIDDLQWGDTDSARLLAEILRSPAPGVMLVLCSRDAVGSAQFLETLGTDVEVHCRMLEPLTGDEAKRLAQSMLPDSASDSEKATLTASAAIARESGGNPFFIKELVRHDNVVAGVPASLDRILLTRVTRLPDKAARILELIAIAGRPVTQSAIGRAAEVADLRSNLDILRAEQLIYSVGLAANDHVESFHDRIREAVTASLSADSLCAHHLSLAESLDHEGDADVEDLADHYSQGGQAERALHYTRLAANRATAALAFDRAARLYRQLLGVMDEAAPERATFALELGDALANAGRGREAAEAFLSAAESDSGTLSDMGELERRAAEQLLRCGCVDEGLEVLEAVLRRAGLSLPKSPKRAFAALLYNRLRLRIRGMNFRERAEADVDARQLARIDATWTVACGLVKVDMIRGTDFACRGLLLSLAAGEPYRIARTLAIHACTEAFEGHRAVKAVSHLLVQIGDLAARVKRPHALGLAHMAVGVSALVRGHWQETLESCDRAEAQFDAEGAGMSWELGTTWAFRATALEFMGRWGALCPRAVEHYTDALARGDLYAAGDMVVFVAYDHLRRDDLAGAHAAIARATTDFTQKGFLVQHYLALLAATQTDLYAGNVEQAWQRYDGRWRALRRSLIFRASLLRAEATDARARTAIALAAQKNDGERRHLLSIAERCARQLRRERMKWCDALACMIDAQTAAVRGAGSDTKAETDAIIAEAFARAEGAYAEADMSLHAAVARRRHGERIGGTEGRQLVDSADTFMRGEGIAVPERAARIHGGPSARDLASISTP